jgi:hypothetical protein
MSLASELLFIAVAKKDWLGGRRFVGNKGGGEITVWVKWLAGKRVAS